ncbi:MAG: C25 family cysteine peptidase [Planctomycetaceae bacterium]|jgi:hypothetical protein|nr:C25 family cysteine peptidase [Planctomycetaceae bacterium]
MKRFFIVLLFFLIFFPDFVRASENVSEFVSEPVSEHIIVVCPQKFYRSLESWIKYRSSQGYTIHILLEPFTAQNIKNRIQILSEQFSVSAILLVGKEVIPSPQIPCRIVQHFGKESSLASDDWYADLNNDGIADVAIGRFAANTVAELDSQIQKTIRYETEIQTGIWCRQFQIVAGISHFSPLLDNVIESTTRYLLTKTIPESYEIALLHASWKSPFCPAPVDYQKELFETVNKSPLFWAYFGHGHPQMLDPFVTPLGSLVTLSVNDFPQFQCRKSFPIAFLFCCYGGILDIEPYSLAEKLIHQPEGPVAVLAASRTTMPYGMSVLGIEILQEYIKKQNEIVQNKIVQKEIVQNEIIEQQNNPPNNCSIKTQQPNNFLTLGSLLRNAKQQAMSPPKQIATKTVPQEQKKTESKNIRQNQSVRKTLETMAKTFDPFPKQLNDQIADHIAMFHLFGDPLLRLPVPKKIRLNCSPQIKSGEQLHLEGVLDNSLSEKNGTINIELVPAFSRLSMNSLLRDEFRIDEKNRRSNNEEYFRSNYRTVLQYNVLISNGSFSFDLPIPATICGEYNIRAFFVSKQEFAIGCIPVSISETSRKP